MSVANEKVEKLSFEIREDLWHVVGGDRNMEITVQCSRKTTDFHMHLCVNLTLHRTVVSEYWFAECYLLSGEGSAGRGSGGPEAVAGRAIDGG